MDGLFLFLMVAYAPVSAREPYTKAVETTRKAAFIQSGYKGDVDRVRGSLEKRVPPAIRHISATVAIVKKKEFTWKGQLVDGAISHDGAKLMLHFEW